MGTSKRFAEMKKETGPYRETSDFSTIGQLPSYLKKGLKKKWKWLLLYYLVIRY